MKFALWLILLLPLCASAKDDYEVAGDYLQIALPVGALATTYLFDDDEGRGQLAKSFFVSWAVMGSMKYTINRQRPSGGNYSFPSGHTTAAFAGASYLQRRYGWKVGVPAYGLASFVGWSRVEAERHYVSDVLAGAGLATTSTYYFVTPKEAEDDGFSLGITWLPKGFGISWSLEF